VSYAFHVFESPAVLEPEAANEAMIARFREQREGNA
jgi:hypothetical protein